MKTTLLSLILILTFNASAQIPLTGMIAGYPFNGNANDVSGNNNNGTVYGATLTTSRTGTPNEAYHFNGTSDYILVPNSTSLTPANTISMCAGVKVEGFYTGTCQVNAIINKGNWAGVAGDYALQFSDNAYDNENCSNTDTLHDTFIATLKTDITTSNPQLYTPYIVGGQWYCIAATFDGTNMRLYVDGVLKATVLATAPLGYNTDSLTFGHALNSLFPYWFHGVIDDIRIYDRALTATEVQGYCSVLAGIDEIENLHNSFEAYPNPSNGEISITLKKNINGQMTISDLPGETIYSERINWIPGKTNAIKLTVAPGFYFIKVFDGENYYCRKIIVKQN